MAGEGIKLVAQNKKAWHDYFIEETFEVGIELAGTEVKSIRQGKVSLKESYVSIIGGEAFIKGMNITPYEQGNIFNKDPKRDRKLLMHRYEINKLIGAVQQQGYSLVPLKIYLKRSLVKMEISLAKGKKNYDKRADIAEKDAKRNIDRKLKEYQR